MEFDIKLNQYPTFQTEINFSRIHQVCDGPTFLLDNQEETDLIDVNDCSGEKLYPVSPLCTLIILTMPYA